MKTNKLWGILMLFLCTLNLTGCNNEDEEGRQITDYKEYLLTVASQQIPGVGWSDGFNYLIGLEHCSFFTHIFNILEYRLKRCVTEFVTFYGVFSYFSSNWWLVVSLQR